MSRTTSTNYGTPGTSFPKADASTDPFLKEDIQELADAVDDHDHSAGRGLAVERLGTDVVTQANIANDAVGQDELSDHASTDALRAVGSNHIKTSAVVERTIADGAVVATKLGVGASAGLTFPRCYAGYTVNSQTITTSTLTAVAFSAADIYDNATMHSPSVTNTRITIGVAGWYLLFGFASWAGNTTGNREVYFRFTRSGTPTYLQVADSRPTNNSAAVTPKVMIVAPFEFQAADYIELIVWQSSGGNLVLADAGFGATAFGG